MTDKTFVKKIRIEASVDRVFGWHERPGTLERLTPPWISLKNIKKTGGLEKGARVSMKGFLGSIPMPLEAEHLEYEKGRLFKDRLVKGPFSKWEHTHLFSPWGDHHSILEDRVVYGLPVHLPQKWQQMVEGELSRMFTYRHKIMQEDLKRHKDRSPLTILISGASGPVGQAMIPFLTTGGHRIIRLVRRKPESLDEIFWNPYQGELDLEPAGKIDVVINLNGYNIASGRWTKKRRAKIIKSRILSTALLSKAVLALSQAPELFISASATGFYGECGDEMVCENSCSGELFISRVCCDWEDAAKDLEASGIRTVFARIGIVLSPGGGILEKLLPGFMMGLGAEIDKGEQFMSWISMDDLLYAVYHVIHTRSIHGAVNFVSPHPVTNSQFTKSLGWVLSRPTLFKIPASIIKILWGEMGEEILLCSTRVFPEKMIDSGFRFCHENLEQALCHVLGKK